MSRGTLIHTNPFGIIRHEELNQAPEGIQQIDELKEEAPVIPDSPPTSVPQETPQDQDAEIVQSYYEDDDVWRYNPNHSRGAAALNGYDRANNDLEYEYPKGDAYLSIRALMFQRSLYVIQILMVVGAGIIMCGAYIAERNGWNFAEANGIIFGKMEEELIYVPYLAGVMSTITAFIGCMGAKSRNKCGSCMLVLYIAALVCSLGLSAGALFQGFADKANVFKYAARQWDQLTMQQEKIFEWEHFCCNFHTLDPCCRFTYGENECVNEYVCFEKVEPHLVEQFETIIICSMLHCVYLFVVLLLSMGVYCFVQIKSKHFLSKNKKNANGNAQRAADYDPDF